MFFRNINFPEDSSVCVPETAQEGPGQNIKKVNNSAPGCG